MDPKKKQTVLIAVLAVLAVGAGGYYFMGSGGSDASNRAVTVGQGTRKHRKVQTTDASKKVKRHKSETKPQERKEVRRKKRIERAQPTARRRQHRRGDRKAVKKAKISPAA